MRLLLSAESDASELGRNLAGLALTFLCSPFRMILSTETERKVNHISWTSHTSTGAQPVPRAPSALDGGAGERPRGTEPGRVLAPDSPRTHAGAGWLASEFTNLAGSALLTKQLDAPGCSRPATANVPIIVGLLEADGQPTRLGVMCDQ